MGEQNKTLSRPIFRRDVSWDPFPNWTQPSRIFAQDFGLPPFLEPNDLDWLDWAKKRLATFSWPGLPQGVDLQHISSSLSGDGVLSVEAPVPGTSTSAPANNEFVIPVQTRQKQDGEK
ncbi:hypothetical protein INR49_015270 [Caranx melampygus]|nr:hypothetical protein INR49_015270 [Caranx melampygus]